MVAEVPLAGLSLVNATPKRNSKKHLGHNPTFSVIWLTLFEPRLGLLPLAVIKIFYLGGGKWLAEHGHAFFPRAFAHNGQSFDAVEMPHAKFDVFP